MQAISTKNHENIDKMILNRRAYFVALSHFLMLHLPAKKCCFCPRGNYSSNFSITLMIVKMTPPTNAVSTMVLGLILAIRVPPMALNRHVGIQ